MSSASLGRDEHPAQVSSAVRELKRLYTPTAMSQRNTASPVLANPRRDRLARRFGEVCRDVRRRSGLSQQEVAARGGCDQSRISEVERGQYLPSLDLAARVATGLGCSLAELVTQWERGGLAPRRRIANSKPGAAPTGRGPDPDLFDQLEGLWRNMSLATAATSRLDDGRYRLSLVVESNWIDVGSDKGADPAPTFGSLRADEKLVLSDGQSMQFTSAANAASGQVIKVDVTVTKQH